MRESRTDLVGKAQGAAVVRFLAGWRVELLTSLMVGVLVAAGVALYLDGRPATYRSTASLLIDQPTAIAVSPNAGVVTKLVRLRVKYTGLVGTSRIEDPVAERLGVPSQRVRGSISASAADDSLLLFVSGTASEPEFAAQLAQATAEELVEYVDREQEDAGVDPQARFRFSVVEEASAARKVSPDRERVVGQAGIIGMLALGATFVVGWLWASRSG